MANNSFEQTVSSLFQGLDSVISTKTVVGEPQVIGDTLILPLVDVSFGMGAGSFGKEAGSNNGAGGIGAKMSPCAILVVTNGEARLVNVKNQDAVTKVLDMVPGTVNKIVSLVKGDKAKSASDEEIEDIINAELSKEE